MDSRRNNVIFNPVVSRHSSVADLLEVFPVFPFGGVHDASGLSLYRNEAHVIKVVATGRLLLKRRVLTGWVTSGELPYLSVPQVFYL